MGVCPRLLPGGVEARARGSEAHNNVAEAKAHEQRRRHGWAEPTTAARAWVDDDSGGLA